jgi:Ni,Fe-hydrogenase III small subunit/ferredoxin
MLKDLKILKRHGKQFIPDITKPVLPTTFKGRPIISDEKIENEDLISLCPTDAISNENGIMIDIGKCTFCGECAFRFPHKVRFSNDYKTATNDRQALIIKEGEEKIIKIDQSMIRKEIKSLFGRSLRLREVSAGGDNSSELELNATVNPNFDMARFGIDWVPSPRHADGLVLTGPITQNMAEALQICYDAIPNPKLLILAGTDAISGGIFIDSPAIDRSFLNDKIVDLYVPGNPVHPLTFVNGILELTRKLKS